MVIYSTKLIKEISKNEFKHLIKGKKVEDSPHAIIIVQNQTWYL
jgi:hypothetical protein